ncbi:Capsular polysaccharide export system inner membrane protein KpsE [Campylobacter hyointestinalis subsp. hyointestinalis]|uniref:Capsular polysaccharide export system inner membrane protein KpsE n=1 Tax=Campylobacter hyointestinalis subsp. hyointestinalis TaxID=91352 RepID=A0A9W5EVX6_CAMHY|nr:Capsular polysaccharide export system inner membrane protein KpsE [Campylobacter hyointestinalis subsp. hyointestinalis]CUU70465.1 Capsular polysaccharide export system inner membrane protein KpsE [Campylobacter hyointestinalis subsp. hyointestinalis]CUU85740.1 Capsular polysaccharide export system inner membrane protein KpsE [Campylobacter hyointestinalis subsp. hyointestinalis]
MNKRAMILRSIKDIKQHKERLNRLDSFKTVIYIMVAVIFYYTFIAADRYVSEVSLTVKSTDGTSQAAISGIESLIGIPSSSTEDTKHLQEYIKSFDMLQKLDEKINLRSLYEKQKLDLFFRIYPSTSKESYLEYYRSRIHLLFDDTTKLLNVAIEGFSPEDARLISTTILEESERFINELSHKISREQMQFAEIELSKAKQKYQEAKQELIIFQNEYGVLDPQTQAQEKANYITEIEIAISKKETELGAMLSYLNEYAPQVIALKSELDALKNQLKKESIKVASSDSNKKLNDLVSKFQDLSLQLKFAEDVYKTALTSVEKARIEASRKVKQLVVIQSPSVPETAIYPQKIYNTITIFIILSLLFGIGRLIKAIIEEHRY